MAQLPLTPDQHRRLIRLIAARANILTPLQRQNLLESAGLSQFVTRLNFDVDARTFSQQLVRVLQEHGTLVETGQPALVSLLREVREIVAGQEEEAAFLDALLAPYEAPTATLRASASPGAGPIRVLFLATNPKDTTHLRLDHEVRTIRERLREADLRDRFHLDQEWAVRDTDLSRSLLAHRPHLVHFAGHGERGGVLVLEDASGNVRPLDPEILSDLFRILRDDIRCVLLNACWSEEQARALVEQAGIPCVIGMTRRIADTSAVAFAAGFYRALGYGRALQTAFELGRNELSFVAPGESDVPRLLTGSGVDPATLTIG
ncbi:MAG: CHAT domain-containing protein [Ardenticatenaceae bacterium]|nr:CHAT domain-containing protein [Ardenticatenaceae bacterium]